MDGWQAPILGFQYWQDTGSRRGRCCPTGDTGTSPSAPGQQLHMTKSRRHGPAILAAYWCWAFFSGLKTCSWMGLGIFYKMNFSVPFLYHPHSFHIGRIVSEFSLPPGDKWLWLQPSQQHYEKTYQWWMKGKTRVATNSSYPPATRWITASFWVILTHYNTKDNNWMNTTQLDMTQVLDNVDIRQLNHLIKL